MEAHPEIRHIVPHTGQRFVYADAILDVLYACEDHYPGEFKDSNDTSTIIRMELAGRRVLWLGDSSPLSSNIAADRFPKESLQCEFLQVGHHGYTGGSYRMYRAARPEVLLWPCPDFWFARVRGWKPNQVLFEECKNIKGIFVGGQREDVIDMSKPTEYVSHYVDVADGETVYEESCNGTRVIDLGWNCVCGGSTGYNGAIFSMTEQGVVMDSLIRPNPVVCMFVQRGQMDLLPDFTLTMKGKVDPQSEIFGLYWNYPNHDKFSADDVLPVFHDADGSFDFKLTADSAAGVFIADHFGNLSVGFRFPEGNFMQRLPYAPLKFCASRGKRDGKFRPASRKILRELLFRPLCDRIGGSRLVFHVHVEIRREKRLPI
jgi:hypothetical protein